MDGQHYFALRIVFDRMIVLKLSRPRQVCRLWKMLIDQSIAARSFKKLKLTEEYRGDPHWHQTYTETVLWEIEQYGFPAIFYITGGKKYVLAKSALEFTLRLAKQCRMVDHLGLIVDYPQRNYLEPTNFVEYIEKKAYTKNLNSILGRRRKVVDACINLIKAENLTLNVQSMDVQTDLLILFDVIRPLTEISLSGYNFCDVQPTKDIKTLQVINSCATVKLRFNAGDIISPKLFFAMNVKSLLCHVAFETFKFRHFIQIMKQWENQERKIDHLTFMFYNPAWFKIYKTSQPRLDEIRREFQSTEYVDDPTFDPSEFYGIHRHRIPVPTWVLQITRKDGQRLFFRINHLYEPLGLHGRHGWAHYEMATKLRSWYHIKDEHFIY